MGVIRMWTGILAVVLALFYAPAASAQGAPAPAPGTQAQQQGAAAAKEPPKQDEAAAAETIDRTPREILYDALVGTYYLVGQLPGGGITYSGKVILLRQGGRMAVVRRIGGEDLQGKAQVDNPESPDPLLEVTFDQGYAMNYSIYRDSDGYPVLAGRIRAVDGSLPGYETLFYDTQFKK